MDLSLLTYFLIAVFCTVVLLLIRNWLKGLEKIDQIDKKYVFVTGCDTGFGERLCVELDKLGCHVFAGCLTADGVQNLKNKCSDNVLPINLDVRNHSNVLKCVEYVKLNLPEGKGLWGIVNNAGVCGAISPAVWLNVEDFREVLQVNLLGSIDVTISLLPLLKSDIDGESVRIVYVTSILSQCLFPCSAPYCISKSALEVFSEVLRLELIDSNISISTIRPGAHESNLTRSVLRSLEISKESSSKNKNFNGENYFKRFLKLESIYMAIFLRKSYKAVIDAYIHALFSKRPKRSYTIGWDSALLILISCIPSCIYYPILKFSRLLPSTSKHF